MDVEFLFNNNKTPLDPTCSLYLFETTNWGPMIADFLLPDPIVNGQIFRIVDTTGLMYDNQVAVWGTYNNKMDLGLDLALCWTNWISREYLYTGDGTNGKCVCISQSITTNPGS